jgi:ABC-type nitrate/sulfonate/bicarbonate transport system permease component
MRLLLPVGRSAWAIAAGYLGLFSFVLIPAPISIIISLIAIRDIRRSKLSAKAKHGMGRAIFGLVMGILGTLLLGIIIFSAL